MKGSTRSSKSGINIRYKGSKKNVFCSVCKNAILGPHIRDKNQKPAHSKCVLLPISKDAQAERMPDWKPEYMGALHDNIETATTKFRSLNSTRFIKEK